MEKNGFSLIELMIVVAIIGMLTAIIYPAYVDYIIRTRVTQGLVLATGAKFAIEETTTIKNALPSNQQETGFVSPSPTNSVQSVTIANDGSGEITISFTALAGNGTIIITPTLSATGTMTWDCTGGTLRARFRPPVCRLYTQDT